MPWCQCVPYQGIGFLESAAFNDFCLEMWGVLQRKIHFNAQDEGSGSCGIIFQIWEHFGFWIIELQMLNLYPLHCYLPSYIEPLFPSQLVNFTYAYTSAPFSLLNIG